MQYDVTIKGTKVLIIYTYKDFTKKISGTFIKGKVFTDDPNEKPGAKTMQAGTIKSVKNF